MPEEMAARLMQGIDSGLSVTDILLSQVDTSDPAMALLTRMLAERSAVSDMDEEPGETADKPDELESKRMERLVKACQTLRHRVEQLHDELEEQQARNDTLAAALGACYLCWGEDSTCALCSGQGVSGYFSINASAFNAVILPVLQTLKTQEKPSKSQQDTACAPVP